MRYLIFCLTFIFPFAAISQDETPKRSFTTRSLMWADLALQAKLNDKWTVKIDIQDRSFLPDFRNDQVLPTVSFSRKFGENWTTGGGFIYFIQSLPVDPKNPVELRRPELRPFQNINLKTAGSKLSLHQRLQIEERFFRRNKNFELTDGYDYAWRFRYRMMVKVPLFNIKQTDIGLNLSEEVFINAGEDIIYNVFDQNRVYGGLSVNIRDRFGIKAGYLYWFQQLSTGHDYLHHHILDLALIYTLDFTRTENGN